MAAGVSMFWLLLCLSIPGSAAENPVIERLEMHGDGSASLRVDVPTGYDFLQIESKSSATNDASWTVRRVVSLDGAAGIREVMVAEDEVNACFKLTCLTQAEIDALAAENDSEFAAQETADQPAPATREDQFGPGVDDAVAGTPEADREVVDADIWARKKDRVYYYNYYRGLHVLDVINPDAPVLLSKLAMPGHGDKMFVLSDSDTVLLMANGSCWYSGESDASLVVIDVSNDVPQVTQALGLPGRVHEARLVGSALYVVTSIYERRETVGPDGEFTWHYGWKTHISSFDFSEPSAPRQISQLEQAGYPNFAYATASHFVLGRYGADWRQHELDLFDISSPDGLTRRLASFAVDGQVQDEYKVEIHNNILSVVSLIRPPHSAWRSAFTTYSLADPMHPNRLGRVTFAENEQLFATRLVRGLAYVVTFEQIDPLWIIDYRDPARPSISGELEVPGFSTYIEPLGDQLVTVGREEWRVAISLFNVADVFNPFLESRVILGHSNTWSSSSALYEEKAFKVLPDEDLILLPIYQNGQRGLQIIDLLDDRLVERGWVQTEDTPLRAQPWADRVIAVGSESFFTVDATDRDAPEMTARIDLVDRVDRVLMHDDFVIELEGGTWLGNGLLTAGELRVLDVDTLSLLHRKPLPGKTLRGIYETENQLYLLLSERADEDTNTILSVMQVGLTSLPAIPMLEVPLLTIPGADSWGDYSAHRLQNGTLVWVRDRYDYFYDDDLGLAGGPRTGFVGGDIAPWYGGSKQLIAMRTDEVVPVFVSQFELKSDGYPSVFSGGDTMLVSSDRWQHVILRSETNDSGEVINTVGHWERDIALHVIDYADPTNPNARTPLRLPGNLVGASPDGSTLYTRTWRYESGNHRLEALAYQSNEVRRIASQVIEGMQDVTVFDDHAFAMRYDPDRQASHLALWKLGPTRQWIKLQEIDNGGWNLQQGENVVTWQSATRQFARFDPEAVLPLRRLGWSTAHGCVYTYGQRGDGDAVRGWVLPGNNFGTILYGPNTPSAD